MRWIQTFPNSRSYNAGYSFVLDSHCERMFTNGYDYRAVLQQFDDDVILLDWGIAIGPSSRHRFEQHAMRSPEMIQVAPYKLYPIDTGRPFAIWAHQSELDKPIERFDLDCKYFGFGAIYLPLGIVMQYLDEMEGVCTSETFSIWHALTFDYRPPVLWDVHLVNMHH